jgi:hypothetical protein
VEEAVRLKETDDIKKDVIKNAQRIAEEEAAVAEKAKGAEVAARAARKLALNTAWMKKTPPCELPPYPIFKLIYYNIIHLLVMYTCVCDECDGRHHHGFLMQIHLDCATISYDVRKLSSFRFHVMLLP